MIVYDAQRQPLTLGDPVGRGGEATVYKVPDRPAVLAKLYHQRLRDGYDLKLAWMQANPPDEPSNVPNHASIAWPTALLYDSGGALVGYEMVHVHNAVPLLMVFNPRSRAKVLPAFNRKYLHRTARNLAAALGALHDRSYIVGDINESNIMVTPSALVTMIDADSFQVIRYIGSKPVYHACPVGKAEYTPPELQGKTFAEVPRQPEHDRFGLAILIFQLLMDGNHPFRAQWLAGGDPPPVEDRIRDGHWPYTRRPGLPIAPPRHAPALDTLHPDLVALMRQCFVDGHSRPAARPTPEAWERAIAGAEKALVQCSQGHYYGRHQRHCPECQARESAVRDAAAQQAALVRAAASPSGSSAKRVPVPSVPPRLAPRLAALLRQIRPVTASAVPVVTLVCARCGASNSGGEIYCQSCASPLARKGRCVHCGRGMPANAKFCPRCGLRQ